MKRGRSCPNQTSTGEKGCEQSEEELEEDNGGGASTTVTTKVVKSDDAKVPIHLWDEQFIDGMPAQIPFKSFRQQIENDQDFGARWDRAVAFMRRQTLKIWK